MTARSPCQQSGTLHDCTPSWHRGTSRACLAGVNTLCMIAHSPCWQKHALHDCTLTVLVEGHRARSPDLQKTPCTAARSPCQPCSTLHDCTPCRQRDTLHTHHAGRSTPCTIAHSLCQQSGTLHNCTLCWQRDALHARHASRSTPYMTAHSPCWQSTPCTLTVLEALARSLLWCYQGVHGAAGLAHSYSQR